MKLLHLVRDIFGKQSSIEELVSAYDCDESASICLSKNKFLYRGIRDSVLRHGQVLRHSSDGEPEVLFFKGSKDRKSYAGRQEKMDIFDNNKANVNLPKRKNSTMCTNIKSATATFSSSRYAIFPHNSVKKFACCVDDFNMNASSIMIDKLLLKKRDKLDFNSFKYEAHTWSRRPDVISILDNMIKFDNYYDALDYLSFYKNFAPEITLVNNVQELFDNNYSEIWFEGPFIAVRDYS